MHVAILGPVPPPHGGVQTHIVGLRNHLMGKGIRVSLINITRHRQTDANGIFYPDSAFGLIRRLLALRPDVIHIHLGGQLNRRVLALCLACAGMPGARTVLTFHSGGYPSSPAGRATRPRSFAGFVLRRLDRLIGVNQEIAEFFHRAGVPRTRTAAIEPHDFTVESGSNGAALPAAIDRFMADHEPVLLSVGLLEPEYEVQLQIQTLPKVRERYPDAGLLMIGSGSLENKLRQTIAASPCADHLLLAGDVPHGATLQAIQRCSLLLRTTRYDGDSVSVREALHLGTPVLATDNGMRPSGVHLLPGLGADSLATGIEKILAAPRSVAGSASAGKDNLERVRSVYQALFERTKGVA